MTTGEKIQKLRKDKGWSQDDLADKMEVSRQSVYKWEADLSLPDKEKMGKLVSLLGVDFNFLMDDRVDVITTPVKEETPLPEPKKEEEKKEEPVKVEEPPKPREVVAVCHYCHGNIYDDEPIKHWTERHIESRNRTTTSDEIICPSCFQKKVDAAKAKELKEARDRKLAGLKHRKQNYIWGGILTALYLTILILVIVKNGIDPVWYSLIAVALPLYTFTGCAILRNNCITDVFISIISKGFVKFPGIIFNASLDGLKFLIVMKVIFFLIAMSLICVTAAAGFVIAGFVSLFVYPFALKKNYANPSDWDGVL